MFRSVFAATCLVFTLAATEAVAEPFDQFVEFCVNTNAEREVVAGAVKGAGWFALPADEIFAEEEEFRDPAFYISADPSGFGDKGPPSDMGMVMTGWGTGEDVADTPGVNMNLCMVAVNQGDVASLSQSMENLLGFESVDRDGETFWIFSRQGDGFRSENAEVDVDDADVPELARRKKLFMATVLTEDNFVGLLMMALRPNE